MEKQNYKSLFAFFLGAAASVALAAISEDWNNPTTTSTYANVLADLKARDVSTAKMDYSSSTNIPSGVIRWSDSAGRFEKWNGSSWGDLQTALTAHLANTSNPHATTAAQVGAASTSALTSHTSNTSNPHSVTTSQIGALAKSSNLSDVTNAGTARTNLSVPEASTVLLKANNLSDVANQSTARNNLAAAESGENSDITSLTNIGTISSVYNILISSGSSYVTVRANGKSWTFEMNGKLTPPSTMRYDYTPWPSGSGGYTVRRSLNPAVATSAQCADSVNTLWADLIALGILQ